jgi:hypothetical protein
MQRLDNNEAKRTMRDKTQRNTVATTGREKTQQPTKQTNERMNKQRKRVRREATTRQEVKT